MDVVRALVGLDRLEVARVLEDGVFVRGPVRAEEITRRNCDVKRHRRVVTLDHRNMAVMPPPLIAEARRVKMHELHLADGRDHPG